MSASDGFLAEKQPDGRWSLWFEMEDFRALDRRDLTADEVLERVAGKDTEYGLTVLLPLPAPLKESQEVAG